MRYADVIVVGAGVVGTFHAYFAARKGYKTLLVERNAFPNDASMRNFGIIAQSIVETGGEWSGYARASAAIYRELQEEHDIGVKVTGSLYLASTEVERRVLEEFAQAASPAYTCSYLDADEVRYRYPFVHASYCTGALLFPDDLTLSPRRMLKQLIVHLVQTGLVEYVPHTTVVAVESGGQQCTIRDAAGNTFAAGRVFVCSGAEYRTLFPELFVAGGFRVCKLQMMQTVPQPGFTLPHALLSGLSIARYPAFTSCPSYRLLREQPVDERIRQYGIHLLFKQLPDGRVVIGDSHEYSDVHDASALEEATNPLIDEAIVGYGSRMIALPPWDIEAMWNGYYLVYPEGEIYTGVVDDTIHIVTGIGGKGMTTGPGFARTYIESVLA